MLFANASIFHGRSTTVKTLDSPSTARVKMAKNKGDDNGQSEGEQYIHFIELIANQASDLCSLLILSRLSR